MARPLVYYISAHGYGHGVRSSDTLRAFHRARPDVPLVLVSTLPEPFLRNRLPGIAFTLRPAALDVGMVQLDSIRVDVPETLSRVMDLFGQRKALLEAEAGFLRDGGAGLVVADIPALPLAAAAGAGLPRLAVGNFAWDWIYGAFRDRDPRWADVAAWFAAEYACADLLLRLPFAEEMKAFPRKEDIGLVASPGRARRDEIAALTGCRTDRKWILLSFTSLDWSDDALDRVAGLKEYEFFTVLPLAWSRRNIHALRREQIGFSDVCASVDAVVSKPGFGLLSDCVVNAKPLLYVDRTDFIEYPVLVRGVERYLQNLHIPGEALYRGDLGPWLEQLWTRPRPRQTLQRDGAETAALRMTEYYRE